MRLPCACGILLLLCVTAAFASSRPQAAAFASSRPQAAAFASSRPQAAAGPSHAQPSSLSVPEYIAELDRWLSATRELARQPRRASDLLENMPPEWQVRTEQRTFTISTESLRRELETWQARHEAVTLRRVSSGLQALRSEAASFQAPAADASDARARLTRILAAREFHDVHGPTWIDAVRQRIARFLIDLLGRALGSSSIPTISRVLVYVLIGCAVVVFALWMYRIMRTGAAYETLLSGPPPLSAKGWAVWLAEARAAANSGHWRDAIHLAYWCGISFLEGQGVWRPDRARTPREYLRLLPSSSEYQPTLATLTRAFERIWYGMQDADADAFAQALAQLKKLGCPST